ncbi:sensor histidine kinase [Streptosporangiaceae bacterium NEAU-GS5]|nr:sensor histidine kinase [Streptosporangiaceae bacterium NEAU-GS5]
MKPRTADLIVAAFFLVAGELEVLLWWTPAEQGPMSVAVPFMAALAVALAWRRVAGLLVAACQAAIVVAWTLVAAPQGSLMPWFMTIVAAYSVAAYGPVLVAAAGLAAVWGSWILFVAVTTNDVADYAFILGFITAACVAGLAVRARQTRAAGAEERALAADERAKTAVAEERARIARELHDVVSHSVSVMVVQAGAAEMVLSSDPERAREPLLRVQEVGREALAELKRLLGLLREADDELALAPAPSLAHLETLLAQVRQSGMPVSLDVEGPMRQLPPGVDLSAYRIIQEALTNALKHAGPARARVGIVYGEDSISIAVVDDGPAGASPRPEGAAGAGHGLIGVRERVAVHGGQLAAGPRPEGGYAVRATLPL